MLSISNMQQVVGESNYRLLAFDLTFKDYRYEKYTFTSRAGAASKMTAPETKFSAPASQHWREM